MEVLNFEYISCYAQIVFVCSSLQFIAERSPINALTTVSNILDHIERSVIEF